ncbi:MAG: methyltransferase domain-containing protein [Parcubacteria group bacterium]
MEKGEKIKFWQKAWGVGYQEKLRKQHFIPFLRGLEQEGKIGEIVIDVGSGSFPMAEYLQKDKKIITIDLFGNETRNEWRQHIRADIEKAKEESSFRFKKAVMKICSFLNIDPRVEKDRERVDTMIFSEILNYVDCKEVLGAFARFLKPGGRFIILNEPGRTFESTRSLLSKKGVENNKKLCKLLEANEFTIEQKEFPLKYDDKEDENYEMIMLVARKDQKT